MVSAGGRRLHDRSYGAQGRPGLRSHDYGARVSGDVLRQSGVRGQSAEAGREGRFMVVHGWGEPPLASGTNGPGITWSAGLE
jgi:hypothetical protein